MTGVWRCIVAMACCVFAGCTPARADDGPGKAGSASVRRIITLAPHLAELVWEAGAGERLVGVVEFSDFPAPVAVLPRVGDAFRVDYEAVLGLQPDLVLGWTSGNPDEVLDRLRSLGLRVVALEPRTLGDIGAHLLAIGELAGTRAAAALAAERYAARLRALQAPDPERAGPRVFMQISARPHFTVTDRHFIGQGLRLCGARNVFGELPGLTAVVSMEAVIAAAPEVIIASEGDEGARSALDEWRRWRTIPAVDAGRLYRVDADLLSRPGPRFLDGVAALCAALREEVR